MLLFLFRFCSIVLSAWFFFLIPSLSVFLCSFRSSLVHFFPPSCDSLGSVLFFSSFVHFVLFDFYFLCYMDDDETTSDDDDDDDVTQDDDDVNTNLGNAIYEYIFISSNLADNIFWQPGFHFRLLPK